MPLLAGWHFVDSKHKSRGVRAPDGRIVSRSEAENTGARWLGYSSEYDYRKHKSERDTYLRDVLRSKQGSSDLEKAKQHAKSQGERFNRREYERILLALHNGQRDANGDPLQRGPDSPLARFQEALGNALTRAWERWTEGTDTP